MSTIPLSEAKDFLGVIHSHDDVKIQLLLQGAEAEALQFLNLAAFTSLPCESSSSSSSSSEPVDAGMTLDVRTGVLFLLQSAYQASPDDRVKLRKAAETLLMPRRCGLGV